MLKLHLYYLIKDSSNLARDEDHPDCNIITVEGYDDLRELYEALVKASDQGYMTHVVQTINVGITANYVNRIEDIA